MDVIVDLPAVRAGRHARAVSAPTIGEAVRDLRALLRGAVVTSLADGVRLDLTMDPLAIAGLADEMRALAGVWPFLTFRVLVAPPACRVEVTGQGPAAEFAQAVFGELAA